MKRTLAATLGLLLTLGLLAACSGEAATAETTSQPAPESDVSSGAGSEAGSGMEEAPLQEQEDSVAKPDGTFLTYRGIVTAVEETGIVVSQQYGYNYGYESVYFHIDDATAIEENGFVLGDGVFVEVSFDGTLTRSQPPQGTAEYINIISAIGEGVVVNGEVLEVEETDDGYTLRLQQYENAAAQDEADSAIETPDLALSGENVVVVHISNNAFESMTAEDLVAGAEISVVTFGIAAMSMPPQVSAHVVLPFAP